MHPLSSAYPIQGRGLESTRAVIKQEAEYTLHQKPVFQGENSEEDNHSNSWPILESPINLTSMWKNTRVAGKNHAGAGRTCKTSTERPEPAETKTQNLLALSITHHHTSVSWH